MHTFHPFAILFKNERTCSISNRIIIDILFHYLLLLIEYHVNCQMLIRFVSLFQFFPIIIQYLCFLFANVSSRVPFSIRLTYLLQQHCTLKTNCLRKREREREKGKNTVHQHRYVEL